MFITHLWFQVGRCVLCVGILKTWFHIFIDVLIYTSHTKDTAVRVQSCEVVLLNEINWSLETRKFHKNLAKCRLFKDVSYPMVNRNDRVWNFRNRLQNRDANSGEPRFPFESFRASLFSTAVRMKGVLLRVLWSIPYIYTYTYRKYII